MPTLPAPVQRTVDVCRPTVSYWMETEVHVYGFSIAANVLLSFFPFLIVLLSLCRYVFEWRAAEQAIYLALGDYFPGEIGAFLRRNLIATVEYRGPFQIASVLLLLFTANGIFEPLEVALNRAWGIRENRTFLKNQVISMGLIFACGGLITASTVLTAFNRELWQKTLGPDSAPLVNVLTLLVFKAAAVPITILILFLVYWLLPNRRLPWRALIPVSVVVGLALEVMKYVNLLTWPWFREKLQGEYGPFVNSVTIILWSFIASMIVLAGAEWAARKNPAITGRLPAPVEPPSLRSLR
ncbi:MAG: YihY/virulence factor BrkB family protein [Bryobacteraceae bacterium]|nr:YihY/virulence factor BrkB family protein [Bryobacteraceae bacterium]